jgi:DNA-binding SARP family transcriptional activator
MLRVSLLGGFSVQQDDEPVKDLHSARLQALLAYLMLHRDAPQSRAYLAYQFWPETSEAQARTNLRNLLHSLRHILPAADCYITATTQILQWQSHSSFTLDVADFEESLNQALDIQKRSNLEVSREALEKAVNLYKGELLPSCYDDWIIPLREGLQQAYLKAVDQLMNLQELQHDYPAAIISAKKLLQHDPLHENTYRHLIRLHALSGDRATALRVYHTCATILKRELDVEPSDATREVYERLLGPEPSIVPMFSHTPAISALVGREQEWTQLLHAWRIISTGGGPLVMMVAGVAGIGKTRLVEEMVQWSARQGITRANACCYAAEGDLAYAPITAWLRAYPIDSLEDVWLTEVARLLPEILTSRPDLPHPEAWTESWQRQRFFEALSRTILSIDQPLLLTIDDLQWCDKETLEWLHYLVRYDQSAKFLLIGTYRPEELWEKHPLETFLRSLRLSGRSKELDLQPLDLHDTQILATKVADFEISNQDAVRIYQETEGNPLFVVETIRAGMHDHANRITERLDQNHLLEIFEGGIDLPPRVQNVLSTRLAQLTQPTRQLAGLAATIGREFSFRLLAHISDCDEDTLVRQLDELWQRRIIREHGVDGYDFSHDKIREVAYKSQSIARRKLLHRNIAQALVSLHSSNLDPVSRLVAAHFDQADLPEQAIPFYLQAAAVARQVYANEEAIGLLKRGITLVESMNDGVAVLVHVVAEQLWEELGNINEMMARHEEALQAYVNAQKRVAKQDIIGQAHLYWKIGVVRREQRLYHEALAACHQAEDILCMQPDEKDNR